MILRRVACLPFLEKGTAGANSRGKVQGGNTKFLTHVFVRWQLHSHEIAITYLMLFRYSSAHRSEVVFHNEFPGLDRGALCRQRSWQDRHVDLRLDKPNERDLGQSV